MGFALEPAYEAVVLDQRVVQSLHREHAVELHAAGAVHDADAAVADHVENLVATVEDLADQRRRHLQKKRERVQKSARVVQDKHRGAES